MEFFGYGGVLFIISFFFFFEKYVIWGYVKTTTGKLKALARFLLASLSVSILILPHETCAHWAIAKTDSIVSAGIIVIGELWLTKCNSRGEGILSAIALAYCLVNATREEQDPSACDSTYKALSTAGLMFALVLFINSFLPSV